MSDVKQVKVDNWGIYFLQRLKHFFNRTDYCDLTLQFQDNAQLKVHRLVLNACTEYFELLERTCEMYEDCLVMPEDLQADVVVPIVNFMYTGQLEFRMEALERLYQTSQVMNMPVLSKLLEAHRVNHSKGTLRRFPKKDASKFTKFSTSTPSSSGKRSFSKAFEMSSNAFNNKNGDQRRIHTVKAAENKIPKTNKNEITIYRDKKLYLPTNKQNSKSNERVPSPIPLDSSLYNKNLVLGEPRPTRYELPEELDTDNVFDNSFTNISYASKPLMVHPDTTKQYSAKKSNAFLEPTSSKKSLRNTVDIVECKKVSNNESIFEDDLSQTAPDDDLFQSAFLSMKDTSPKDPGQLFDQILDNNDGPKVTIESKDKQASNLDHAKIISEVLKRYPHLVNTNKNIKLKILNTPPKGKKVRPPSVHVEEVKEVKSEDTYTYETDVLDSKEAAKLISLGAENIKGPWICLICGTPGRALNFTSYYNFRRHLVEVHKEKQVLTICEYCGLKSFKRKYLLHHLYTKHGVPPPPAYHFPKCPSCDYIALTEGFLVKHKLTHCDTKITARCFGCSQGFTSTNQLLLHVQKSGHKQQILESDKKPSIQCTYCMKVFLRDNNFYCHLKTSHKYQATRDGLIDESDDEKQVDEKPRLNDLKPNIKHEQTGFEHEIVEEVPIQFELPKQHETNIQISKKSRISINTNQKILNTGYSTKPIKQSQKVNSVSNLNTEFIQEVSCPSQGSEENIVVINDVEYIMKNNQLLPRKTKSTNDEYIISDYIPDDDASSERLQNLDNVTPTTSMDITNSMHSNEIVQQPKMIIKKSASLNQPIQIVVSNEEEYKALMASNHSIIFDDGDPNKTLTVLTAPQNTSIDTTGIDLDNTQSNDMMIIQENYPLNVSEAVPGDNSKYVVVYSHAMDHDDPNKQFQIITSQDIGAQYVQNSAVLTQNFNTITTSTSVTNVIGTPIQQTWPQSDEHNVNQTAILVTPEAELQTITEEQTNVKEMENHLEGLPEAEILRIPSKSALVHLEQCNVDQSNTVTLETIANINPEHMVVEDNQSSNVNESMDIEITPVAVANNEDTVVENTTQMNDVTEIGAEYPVEMTIENVTEEPSQVCLSEQEQHQNMTVSEQTQGSSIVSEQHDTCQTITEQCEVPIQDEQSGKNIEDSNCVDENVNTENLEQDPTATNVIEEIPQVQEESGDVIEEVQKQIDNAKQPFVETAHEIRNLTSEWSEDEYDNILEDPGTCENTVISQNKNPITEEPVELEESIENIQQEVQRQINYVDLDVTTEVERLQNDTSNDQEQKPLHPNTAVVNIEETQEKISSLLNDWEDNDSQEDNTSINENGDDNPATIENLASNENDSSGAINIDQVDKIQAPKDETKKDDNIKSLVSDWDDDEDENKE